jgi:hypothetical protein
MMWPDFSSPLPCTSRPRSFADAVCVGRSVGGGTVGRAIGSLWRVRATQVWILADDLNYDLVRTTRGKMPNLQKRMITKGLEFSNHVAVAPVCGPSRSSLLAGRFIHNVG